MLFRFILKYRFLYFVCTASIFTAELPAQDHPGELPDQVTLQLKWRHQFQFAGYYAAIEKGYYREAGIAVTLLEAEEGKEPADAVFDGTADFGVTTSDILILRSEGKEAVLLASIFQHSAQILVASKESGISNAQDLYGKRIALEPHAADIITYMNDEGVTLNDVIIYPHSFDVSLLTGGEVDALTAYISDEPFSLREAGFEYTIIDPSMGGIDFYGDVLFTTESLVKNNPDLAERFLEASVKGWAYAMSNTGEIIDLIHEKYSQRHSKEHLRFEAERMQRLIMPDVVEIGYSNPGRWQRILEIYGEQRMLAHPISLEGLFYTDYIRPGTIIPWRLLIIFGVILFGIASATVFYYNTANKLRLESEKRLLAQQQLQASEKRLQESNAAKDKFFSILAHDLRNPFTAISGFADLLILNVKEENYDSLIENLLIVKNTSLYASDLLSNLLMWSRTQLGDIEYNPEIFDLSELINKNVTLVRSQALQKDITITSHTDADKKHLIFGDKNMIGTIVLNLLTNAIKFTNPSGRVDIGISMTKTESEVYVKDTGVGISKENIEKLFSLETRYTTEGTSSERGSGLGLLLCKEFIEKHSGSISVESTPKQGSIFRFSLPRFNTF